MRISLIAALAALGLTACGQPDATVDEQAAATATNADVSADAAATAAAADASSVTSVDESIGP